MVKYFEGSKYPCDIMFLSYFDFKVIQISIIKGKKNEREFKI